jgi:hypothetical protein
VLSFADRANDRPASAGEAGVPVRFAMRSDFVSAFDTCLKDIHDLGCALPLLRATAPLPAFSATVAPPIDLLIYLGRALDLAPTAALNAPAVDPLALARPTAVGPLRVVARQLDTGAPKATNVVPGDWTAWKCDGTGCSEVALPNTTYLNLWPLLNAAGWYQPAPAAPTSPIDPGRYTRWTNITGLVAGQSRYGDELEMLYSPVQITASALRDRASWVWDGSAFAPSP